MIRVLVAEDSRDRPCAAGGDPAAATPRSRSSARRGTARGRRADAEAPARPGDHGHPHAAAGRPGGDQGDHDHRADADRDRHRRASRPARSRCRWTRSAGRRPGRARQAARARSRPASRRRPGSWSRRSRRWPRSRSCATGGPRPATAAARRPRARRRPGRGRRSRVVAIAASTGGPAALQRLLSGLPGDFPAPILVVQHITPGFIAGLATWLDGGCDLRVKVAEQGEPLRPRTVYLAPDDRHLGVSSRGTVAALDRAAGRRLPAVGDLPVRVGRPGPTAPRPWPSS